MNRAMRTRQESSLPPLTIEMATTAEGCAVLTDASGAYEIITLACPESAELRTERVCRQFRGRERWIAWDDRIGCEPGSPLGRGDTEAEAIADYAEQQAGTS